MLEEAQNLLPLPESPHQTVEYSPGSQDGKTEPNSPDRQEFICNNSSTKCSSLAVEKYNNIDSNCVMSCHENYKQMSIISKQSDGGGGGGGEDVNSLDLVTVKERHMSIDSARDSGIGDNSNFADLETKFDDTSDENTDDNPTNADGGCCRGNQSGGVNCFESATSSSDLKGYWQPKIKKSLADRLPPNTFYLVKPNRYIFPGAEVFYDPDEKYAYHPDSSSSGNSEDESESEATNQLF